MNIIRRAWLRLIADWRLLALVEYEMKLVNSYPSDDITDLLDRRLSAKKALFAAEANLRQMRDTDGADYAILVALLVMAAWAYVSEMDYRDLTAPSTVCLYRGC